MKQKFSWLISLALLLSVIGSFGFGSNAAAAEQEKNSQTEKVIVTFEPAVKKSSIFKPLDQTLPLGVGSVYYLSGSSWVILYGSNVVSLSGNKATMIGVGTAQVKAFKSNGDTLGVYTFVVSK